MTGFDPTDLLDVWEAGRGLDTASRALAIWQAATGRPVGELAALPVGRRDAELLAHRIATFGPKTGAYAECPACGDGLELDLDLRRFLLGAPTAASHRIDLDGWQVEVRLPTTDDLRAARATPDPRAALLAACIVSATEHGRPQPADSVPDELHPALDHALHELDPQSDIELKLTCAVCEHAWTSRFDVAGFYWREIEVEAGRLLAQVHALARAYGWTEADVLALSPTRRAAYLDLVGGWT